MSDAELLGLKQGDLVTADIGAEKRVLCEVMRVRPADQSWVRPSVVLQRKSGNRKPQPFRRWSKDITLHERLARPADYDFDATATAMANAVLAGDRAAALALADYIVGREG